MPAARRARDDRGLVLLTTLIVLLIVGASAVTFVWFMNQQQARAGGRLRSAAALAAAEAGVHRASAVLESTVPGGSSPGRAWRPAAYAEELPPGRPGGRFTLSVADAAGGAVLVTSAGEAGGVIRRLKARVHLASPALLAALYGAGFVRLEQPPAATFLLPYGAGIGDRPWIHIAAGEEIWFATTDVAVNDPTAGFEAAPGPADGPAGAAGPTGALRPGPVRLLLARGAELTLYRERQRVDIQQLRTMGVYVEGVVLRSDALPPLPEVDREFYKSLAAANAGNSDLNGAAGTYTGDDALRRKRDSLYTAQQFATLMTYLETGRRPPQMHGVVYVTGGLSLADGRELHLADGALVAESAVFLGREAVLSITHTPASRTLPGLLVLDRGGLIVTQGARLRVHGLVDVNRVISIDAAARVDVVGSVVGRDPGLSFRNFGGAVVIRYDPAVLGTPGLRVPEASPVVAWVSGWEEVP